VKRKTQTSFQALIRSAQVCRRCPNAGGHPILSEANGPILSKVIFVAEAPGRLGAARTGVPLQGDATGRNFERLLATLGLSRKDVFVTNAVLCSLMKRGCNRAPSRAEVENCRYFLAHTIELIDPRLVVALGRTAFDTLLELSPQGFTFPQDCGKALSWNGRTLFCTFHPSPRNFNHPVRRAQLLKQLEELAKTLQNLG
jgi:uracil-DNA glycosylase